MKRQSSVGIYYLATMAIITLFLIATSSCGTSHGCNYAKAQKYNARQMRKAHRYYH